MRKLLPLLLGVLVLIASFTGVENSYAQKRKLPKKTPPEKELSAKQIAKRALPSVALIICDNKNTKGVTLGSGFFIRPGVLVTNYHVIEGNTRGAVRVSVGTKQEQKIFRIARIIAYDKESDLALLSVPRASTFKIPSLSFSTAAVETGEDIYALGNPKGFVGTISPGIVSADIRATEKKARIQITAPISHGSSGGPVVNNKGQVVGVAVGGIESGQNLNFAVPVVLVNKLVKTARFPTKREVASEVTRERISNLEDDTSPPVPWLSPNSDALPDLSGLVAKKSVILPLRKGERQEVASLRGLEGVGVIVETIGGSGSDVVTKDRLQNILELGLRRNRIKVLTGAERYTAAGTPFVYLNVLITRVSSGYVMNYKLSLNQEVCLERDKEFCMFAIQTWDTAGSAVGGRAPRQYFYEIIQEALDLFANDYLKANSK